MRLIRDGIEIELMNVRSNNDRRKRVDRFVISYIGQDDGLEYRKSFEFPVGTIGKGMPDVPVTIFQ